jgi:hypothetical protein
MYRSNENYRRVTFSLNMSCANPTPLLPGTLVSVPTLY